MELYEFMEVCMIVAFGCSWPVNVVKSYQVRTTKGKSLAFLLLIFCGYIFGIVGKFLSPGYRWYVLFFYILNCTLVGVDLLLYVRNYRLDQKRESENSGF